uniref:BBS2_C domain-containing protein n=1 Tax=Panagrellus redivivus TaxID=6233 RepID=A0A7E4UX88_PANRE
MLNAPKLYRTDYAQVGTTNRGCLRVIHFDPAGEPENKGSIFRRNSKKGRQKDVAGDKVVVGSQDGILLCLERKSVDTKIIFKTPTGPPITQVALGGALNTILDKTFIAAGGLIKGFSKKGKQFLSFETNITDPIESMYIYGVDMFLCGRAVFYHFHDCVEANCYVCPERINDILCLPVVEGGWVGRGITPVIACDDKTLKVFENGEQVYDVSVGDVPLTLHLFMNDGGYNKQKVLYGTKSGRLGLVDLQKESGIINWESPTQTAGGISCIACYKITETGFSDVVIGKDDGTIEVYSIDDEETIHFRMIYQCEESITGLDCGRFNSENVVEIIVGTYTGWIFALTTEPAKEQKEALTAPQMEIKVQHLRNELDEIEMKVREERERYEDQTQSKPDTMTTIPPFSVNDRFILDKESMCYLLSIELVIPIEYIVLHSDADVELMDIARSTAVVSFTKPPPEPPFKMNTASSPPPSKLLATYRCQADTTRIEMRIRSIEGRGGTLKAYIVPDMRPKMCQLVVSCWCTWFYAHIMIAAFQIFMQQEVNPRSWNTCRKIA